MAGVEHIPELVEFSKENLAKSDGKMSDLVVCFVVLPFVEALAFVAD